MALTPQMKQSITLLAMSTYDINEYIETALSANPFLKKEITAPKKKSSDDYDYIANIKQRENPRLSLISQIKTIGLTDKLSEIAEYLIYEMDDNGYITIDLEEAAGSLSVDIEDAKKALLAIQGMEPAGIGARDVTECLKLQLERLGKENSLEYAIVTEFIGELAKNDIDKISKKLNTDKKNIQNAINNIKKLNPRPASNMLSEEVQKVVPDLIAEVGRQRINLQLNKDWLPCLKFHNLYENEPGVAEDPAAKKFIKENMEQAKVLIDNLKRREDTIFKVADYILNFQKDNFINEGSEIKSLTIKDVAEKLNLHPSTISRAISNKYIQIDNEVMPIGSLLSKGVRKQDGEITSKIAIKKKIESIIKNEDKSSPLTDDQIKDILGKEDIAVKRRTIAKYRNFLHILPTYLRKKIKTST